MSAAELVPFVDAFKMVDFGGVPGKTLMCTCALLWIVGITDEEEHVQSAQESCSGL